MVCCCVEFSTALMFTAKGLFPNMLHSWRPALLTLEYNLNTQDTQKSHKITSYMIHMVQSLYNCSGWQN